MDARSRIAAPGEHDGAFKRKLRTRLLRWYDRSRRELPWRATRDPYHVWISEIMLQQTQVATVVPYFERFVAEFPSIAELAAASEEQVLRAWEGLGYYRRARHLHQAAGQIVRDHQGQFPASSEEVQALPGIGRYTAGAILSIAWDQRLPILEANTLRLYSRLLGYRDDPRSSAGQSALWKAAESWLPTQRVGDFNQALMELGSRICTPRDPDCDNCPLAELCAARRLGLQAEIPLPPRKPQIESVRQAAVVVRRNQEVLLLRRDDAPRWAGMWDFPRFELEATDPRGMADELARRVAETAGVKIERPAPLSTLRHGVTRFRITLECFTAECGRQLAKPAGLTERRWVKPAELEPFPLSVTGRKLARLADRQT